jgi:hypothetical protein
MSTLIPPIPPPATKESIAKNNERLRGLKSGLKNFFSGPSKQTDNPVDKTLENAFTERDSVFELKNPINQAEINDSPPLDKPDDDDTNSEVEDTATEDMPWINPETTKNLIDIAVDILKQTIDNETQTMTSLLGIAVDILTKTIEARTDEIPRTDKGYGFKGITLPTLEYTLPKASVRLKDIVISTKHVNYYDSSGSPVTPSESTESDEQSAESNVKPISRIVPVYDGTNVKITAYTIEDYENGENGEKNEKIITELNLAEIKLTDLQNPEKKQEIITNIIENLKKDHDVDLDTEKSIEDYLGKLGEAISKLKGNVDGLGEDVDQIVKKYK